MSFLSPAVKAVSEMFLSGRKNRRKRRSRNLRFNERKKEWKRRNEISPDEKRRGIATMTCSEQFFSSFPFPLEDLPIINGYYFEHLTSYRHQPIRELGTAVQLYPSVETPNFNFHSFALREFVSLAKKCSYFIPCKNSQFTERTR